MFSIELELHGDKCNATMWEFVQEHLHLRTNFGYGSRSVESVVDTSESQVHQTIVTICQIGSG